MLRSHTSRVMSTGAVLVLVLGAVMIGGPAAAQEAPPPQPGNLRVVDLQANHAVVAWQASAGAEDYLVELTGATNRGFITTELTHTLHLLQDQTYQVEVFARGPAGRSTPSQPVTFTTLVDPANPPVTTPDGFQVDVGTSSVTVQWQPSASDAGVTSYSAELNGRRLWTQQPSMTLHLQPDQSFRFMAQAQDAAFRRSDWSEPVQFTTPDEPAVTTPASVQVSEAPGTATVTWQAASSDAGILDYLVSVVGGPSGPITRRTSELAATVEVPPGGDLSVTVRARDTAQRTSDLSDPVAFTLEPAEDWAPPGAPGNLQAIFDSNGFLERLEWEAASGGGGDPLLYHVNMSDTGEIQRTQELHVDALGFARCPTTPSPNQFELFVTASASGNESPASNPVTLCF